MRKCERATQGHHTDTSRALAPALRAACRAAISVPASVHSQWPQQSKNGNCAVNSEHTILPALSVFIFGFWFLLIIYVEENTRKPNMRSSRSPPSGSPLAVNPSVLPVVTWEYTDDPRWGGDRAFGLLVLSRFSHWKARWLCEVRRC